MVDSLPTQLIPPKPQGTLRVYAYSIDDPAHAGLLKIGQTTQDVKQRVRQQLLTAAIENYTIVLDESAARDDGTFFSDHELRAHLLAKGFARAMGEWVECTVADVQTAIAELRSGLRFTGTHHETFAMRPEQEAAVEKTQAYFDLIRRKEPGKTPRFLWNAKMRFGKTFAAYQLAKRMEAKRVLIVTFKPAVEDSWETDLRSHVEFEGWEFMSGTGGGDPSAGDAPTLIYFGSFQDLLGRDKAGNIKAKNEWLHEVTWDLVVFDEYHFGAWRENARELFAGEDPEVADKELAVEFGDALVKFDEEMRELSQDETEFLPITGRAFLYLSGTPFRALTTGEFIEEQIFNWTYTNEQRAKQEFAVAHPDEPNPYAEMPEMRLFTYKMPDELIAVAHQGEFDEFDLNAFFEAKGRGGEAAFTHKDDVQKWLDIIRGAHLPTQVEAWRAGKAPPEPYYDTGLLPWLQHSIWFLPNVAACHAMANLLAERQNTYWHDYAVKVVAGAAAGVGVDALPPVREAIGDGQETKTITLTCGKLMTGVTVPQWSAILMLLNLEAPESYFQAAFRVQSPWSINNPEGDDPNETKVLKPVCFVFDFAPTRALRLLAEYGTRLAPNEPNQERALEELISFLPVLAYDGLDMRRLDAGIILDLAMSGTSATLLARKWQSAILVNVDNDTLRRIMANEAALAAVMNIEGFRALGSEAFDTVINKSEAVSRTRRERGEDLDERERRELTAEEREYKRKRKEIQEKLVKFATKIPAFMYLTDFRENTLVDVITKLEPDLFKTVTGLSVEDFHLLVSVGVFNATHMNQAIFAFRRYEDASLSYTGIDSHPGLRRYGLYDTAVVVAAQPSGAAAVGGD
jgi:hypothetical protein